MYTLGRGLLGSKQFVSNSVHQASMQRHFIRPSSATVCCGSFIRYLGGPRVVVDPHAAKRPLNNISITGSTCMKICLTPGWSPTNSGGQFHFLTIFIGRKRLHMGDVTYQVAFRYWRHRGAFDIFELPISSLSLASLASV